MDYLIYIYIVRIRVAKKVPKYATTYRESRYAMKLQKTAATIEGILKPRYKVHL